MQAYLPIIQDLLSQWYQLTLDNAAYAAALTASVWLLTVLFYRIRIAFIKRTNRAKAKEAQNSIDTAQQQTQKLQEELSANTARMEESEIAANTATQRALVLERRMTEHNMQLSDSLRALTVSFNLDRPALSAEGDLGPEGLWQQYSAAVAQLAEHLRAEQQSKTELQQAHQAETAKLAEKEALLGTLQAQLDTQARQLSELTEQNTLLQQQISDSAQKQQSEMARLAELEKLAVEWAHAKTQQLQLEEKIFAQNILIAQLQKDRPVEQTQPSVDEQPQHAPVELEEAEVETLAVSFDTEQPSLAPAEDTINDADDKTGYLFDNAWQQATELGEEAPAVPGNSDKITEEPRFVVSESHMEAVQAESSGTESQPLEDQSPGFPGKLKHLFGNAMQQIATAGKKTEKSLPVRMEDEATDVQPAPSSKAPQPAGADAAKEKSTDVTGKIRNLFGVRKSLNAPIKQDEQEPVSEPAQQRSSDEAAGTDGANRKIPTQLKGLFRKFQPNA